MSSSDGSGESLVVEHGGVGDAGVGKPSRSMRRRASSSSSSGQSRPDGLAARCGLWLVAGEDRREALDERGTVAVAASGLELRLQDLGTPLHETPQQRQVLTLGEALVATRPEVVEAQVVEPLDVRGVADSVDTSVRGVLLLVAHAAHPTARRAAWGEEPGTSADAEQGACTG